MKSLVPLNKYGLFATQDNIVKVDSRFIAQFFEKNHKDVLRDIRKICSENSGLSKYFTELYFALSNKKNNLD